MKRSILGLLIGSLALLLSAPVSAQVVNIGEGGKVDIKMGKQRIRTGHGKTIIKNGKQRIQTGKAGTKIRNGGQVVETGKAGTKIINGKQRIQTGPAGTKIRNGGQVVETGPAGTKIQNGAQAINTGTKITVPKGLKKMGTFHCGDSDDKTLTNVAILAKGDGIVASGSCTLVLKNVTVQAKRAIVVKDSATVTLNGCTIHGSSYAVLAAGSGDVNIAGSVVKGRLATKDSADITKKGGNTFKR